MNRISVIIPSCTVNNLRQCIDRIRQYEPGMSVIVVNDGLEPPDWRPVPMGLPYMEIPGVNPFIYARNINLGIKAAGGDDVILLNDDALLETPGGFTALQQVAANHPECGLMSAATNGGNLRQRRQPGDSVRYDHPMVAFVCVFIPRTTLTKVGLLDERFGLKADAKIGPRGYGCDDDDYCWRVERHANMKLGIYDGCFVDHRSLTSTFRGNPKRPADVILHEQLFLKKWGRHPRNP